MTDHKTPYSDPLDDSDRWVQYANQLQDKEREQQRAQAEREAAKKKRAEMAKGIWLNMRALFLALDHLYEAAFSAGCVLAGGYALMSIGDGHDTLLHVAAAVAFFYVPIHMRRQ
jgi:hypothetical protein